MLAAMAGPTEIIVFKDALIVLGTAAVVAPVLQRLKISPIMGFFAVGATLGPHGLGALADHSRVIDWITVTGEKQIAFIADLGIVFLLFFIGLELSMRRLLTMRRLVFGLGGLQGFLTALAISLGALWLGQPPAAALIIGSCLALSSTAIVMELLSAQRRMMSTTGRTSFAILLAQDLAVVPLLFLISALGSHSEGSVLQGIAIALVEAAVAVGVIAVVGRLLLKPLFRLAAGTDSPEFFMAAILLIAVGSGVIAAYAGVSMAPGAVIAGLLLSETEYRRAVEAMSDPFRGLLLGVFFFSVGMHIDLGFILREPLLVATAFAALIIGKALLLAPLCRLFGIPWAASVETSLLLAPGGEFAFIGIGLATQFKLIDGGIAAGVLAVVALTMVSLPFMASLARKTAMRLETAAPAGAVSTLLPPADHARRVIVVGHGRVGQLVCDMLDQHDIAYLATDKDAAVVERWRKLGRSIYYGDAASPLYLRRCGLEEATAVMVARMVMLNPMPCRSSFKYCRLHCFGVASHR